MVLDCVTKHTSQVLKLTSVCTEEGRWGGDVEEQERPNLNDFYYVQV